MLGSLGGGAANSGSGSKSSDGGPLSKLPVVGGMLGGKDEKSEKCELIKFILDVGSLISLYIFIDDHIFILIAKTKLRGPGKLSLNFST